LPQGVAAPAEWKSPVVSYLQGLGISAASGITELAGYTIPGADEFRQDNPAMGLVSSFAAGSIPYLSWFATAKKVKRIADVVNTIGNIEKSPYLVGAAREATTLLPFEVGRVGLSQMLPQAQASFADMTGQALLDLTLSAGLGGVFHGVSAAGRRTQPQAIPGLDLALPPPLQIRKLKELVAGTTLTPAESGAAVNKLKRLDEIARMETAKPKQYVSEVNNNPALTRTLGSLFEVTRQSGVTKKRMFGVGDKRGFPDDKSWQDAAHWNGLKPGFAETGRYFREITFEPTGKTAAKVAELSDQLKLMMAGKITPEQLQKFADRQLEKNYAATRAAAVDKQLREGMQSLGFGWLMAKEENGLYILARKTRGKFKEERLMIAGCCLRPINQGCIFKTSQVHR
jgi:hypothetical protein